jgi:hypothetical protein
MAEIGIPLLMFELQRETYSRFWFNSGKPIPLSAGWLPAISWLASSYQLVGFPLSVICSSRPIKMDRRHILAWAAEPGFLRFKEQALFELKFKMLPVQSEWKTSRLL